MGASQSAHKLTVVNEDEGKVIHVSNAVVQRLSEGFRNTSNPSGEADVRVQSPRKSATSERGEVPAPLPQGNVPPSGYPSFYYPEYTISALEMQKQKEAEIDELDHYWQKRLLNLEKRHEEINNVLKCEYNKAVTEYKDSKRGNGDLKVPCVQSTGEIAKCYQDHPNQALECAPLVKEFASCVDDCRSKILASRA